MKPPITDYHTELTRAFLARRCSVCGAQATVIAVRLGEPDLNYCLPCSPSPVQPSRQPEAGQPPGVVGGPFDCVIAVSFAGHRRPEHC